MGCACLWLELISTICLLFTIIYKQLRCGPSRHRTCLVFHSFTMMVYYMSVLPEHITGGHNFIWCYIFFFSKYYSMTSAFIWLTALAFDICCSFLFCQPSNCQSRITRGTNTLLKYHLFAWGFPLIQCIIAAIVEWNIHLQKLLTIYPRTFGSCQCLCWFANPFVTLVFHHVCNVFGSYKHHFVRNHYINNQSSKERGETLILNSPRQKQM